MRERFLRKKGLIKAIDFPAAQLGLELEEIFEEELPTSGAVRMIPIYRKVGSTPKEFPRPWARMKKRPLRKPDAPGYYRPDQTPD